MAPQTPIPKAESVEETNIKEDKEGPPSMQIVWRNVAIMSYLHLAAIYGLFLLPSSHILTWAWSSFCFFASGLGVTAGAHRLWSHRSFKATWPLRAALMVLNCMAVQNDIYEWTRDHRVHHKFTETDADPHNAKRGFFFSHIGWLMVKKHPDVKRLGKKVDLRDLEEDKIVMFQKRYYKSLALLFCVVIPTLVPYFLWSESLWNAYFVSFAFRYVFSLNAAWSVNSVAHLWGNKPYDKYINPAENMIADVLSCGEGYHNYHHTFPYDYRASEFGKVVDFWMGLNLTTMFINMWASMGLAYDLRTVSESVIHQRRLRTGDLETVKEE